MTTATDCVASVRRIPCKREPIYDLTVSQGYLPEFFANNILVHNSSEGELQVWDHRVHAMQEHLFNEPIKVVLEVIQLDQFGEIDPDIYFDWEPLKEANEEEEGKAKKNQAEMDQMYVNMGAIGPDEMRQELSSRPDSPYAAIDFSAPPPVLPETEPDPLDDKDDDDKDDADSDAESGADR